MKKQSKKRACHRQGKRLLSVIACIVAFATIFSLILPAVTLEEPVAESDPDIVSEQTAEEPAAAESIDSAAAEDEYHPDDRDTTGDEILPSEMTAQQFSAMADDAVWVGVNAEEGAFPAGTTMNVTRVTDEDVLAIMGAAVDGNVTDVQAVDITFRDCHGREIKPEKGITVTMASDLIAEADSVIVHMDDAGDTEIVNDVVRRDNRVSFDAGAFPVYAIVGTETIIAPFTASDGNTYEVTVTCGADAGVPEGAQLLVTEVTRSHPEYAFYLSQTAAMIDSEAASLNYIKLLNISIVDQNGDEITLNVPVDVQIQLLDREEIGKTTQIVHFAHDEKTNAEVPELMDRTIEDNVVAFQTAKFSAYAIVEGPAAVSTGWSKVDSFEQLCSIGAEGLYIGHTDGYYFTNGITRINNTRTGITKTKPPQSSPSPTAVKYYFEQVAGTADQFKIYCLDGETKKYVIQSTNSLNFTTEDAASVFTIETGSSADIFRVKGRDNYYWNMQGGAAGASFAAYQSATDGNAQFHFWYRDEVTSDPYDLDGTSYGLMNWNGGVVGKALMGSSSTANTLDAKLLTVMSTLDHQNHLFVPNDSTISMWNFQWVGEDQYYLTTVVDGSTKYLRLDASGLSMVSATDDNCKIQVIPGTGIHAGEICLKSGNNTLTFSGSVDSGFTVNGTVGSEWLKLVEQSELTTDYFLTYSASKVSVSNPAITNGSRVIVYTRYWNETQKRYDYYAISSDGTLVPVYASGDSIEWVSGQINTLLWNFVEYYWEDTNDPNFYYELYNQYSEKFIAPQVTDGQILSDDTIGINLNGRRDGQYYSTILAWDEMNYSYVGLKVEDGHIVSCPKSEAMDFYFAVMHDLNVDDSMTTVPTVDHNSYGITMKLVDFATREEMSSFLGNDDGGVGNTLHQGMLTTELGPDGYPSAANTDGGSLGTLFSGAKPVNHLFIQSTYDETGYFEYSSMQNFASLQGKDSGDFTVYKELGSYDSGGNRNTLKHGQFFPFNDLQSGVFASVNGKNLYSLTGALNGEQLSDDDPRKYENLYSVEYPGAKVNCHFGLELEAGFTQTPSGLDAWGHDIIFEFTGDDDFWLYVDDELVIDLGGIHSAVPGSVNFRTGDVYVNGEHTTLKDVFYNNYVSRGHTAEEAEAYVNEKFEQNSSGQWVFRDFTNHIMRIFYMERGAGASNLYMRFNLAAVKKGTVQLSKQLSGVDSSEDVLVEYPYQILYKTEDGTEHYLQNILNPSDPTQNEAYVLYKDSVKPVKYMSSITIAGVTYNDVFFLKPGETADISFPENMVSYRIVECGVNTDVYDHVLVNEEEISGTGGDGYEENRKDFGIHYATTNERARVNYVNVVNPDALRTITIQKQLFREDGESPIHYPEDKTTFSFRLYLASEFEEQLDVANMHAYHVKDPDGNYCRWDAEHQEFTKIGDGITSYDDLTPVQKVLASFTTSIYGSISKIPADFTVEIRNVLAGTQFKVEERPGEIPDGYSFQRYVYNGENRDEAEAAGISDVVISNVDPNVIIRNLKGWGLRVNKTWSDENYMSERDATYFAIFTVDNGGNLTLVSEPNTVRQLPFSAQPQTLYWYFQRLADGFDFADYVIREVTISGDSPVVDSDGVVTEYGTVTPIAPGASVNLNGKQKGETESSEFTYAVLYAPGSATGDSNVRVDTVTNDRPGIMLKKTEWDGITPLAGATFTLEDNQGNRIGTFTSDEAGLITVAFLRENVAYTLTEIDSPGTWYGLEAPMTITLQGKTITVSGVDSSYYTVGEDTDNPTLTIKNRPYTFQAVKKDRDTDEAMAGVHFALHRQVTVDGVTTIDLNPMPGYENLVTDSDGVIPRVDNTLPAGTYELREKATLSGYEMLPAYIRFTVSDTGKITLEAHPDGVELEVHASQDEEGVVSYVLSIPNRRPGDIALRKVDSEGSLLTGSKFQLCRKDGTSWEPVSRYSEIDLTESSEITLSGLTSDLYRLTETKAPDGYIMLAKDVYFRIDFDSSGTVRVTLTDEEGSGENENTNVTVNGTTIIVSNTAGTGLPEAGGSGTLPYTLGGIALILASILMYGFSMRRRRKGAQEQTL